MRHGFDQNACNELLKAAEKYGSAPGTIGAVNKYNGIHEINLEVEARKAELGNLEAGVKKLQTENTSLLSQNAEANQLLGQIDEKYRQSKYLHDIASIVTDPQGARIPGPALARIGVSFLTGFMMCAEAYPDQNRKLITAARSNIDYTVANLNNYLRGT
jgi:regulator of replication initiation timing